MSPKELLVSIPHGVVRNFIVLAQFKEFFVTVRIIIRVKAGFVRQWNLQSFENSCHVIRSAKSI